MKEGSWFVQPPVEVLEQFIAVRIQLDDHADATGPLEVVPGSHANGRLASAEVSQRASTRVRCEVPRGGALVMRPLIIHASGKSRSEFPRRVLHYLYGPLLPLPLR
jgi:ectoine hydroxylase-related dioxygenase (phytanoyl-CoA dioxygenase family)